MEKIKVFSGTANPELSEKISEFLDVPLSKTDIKQFSDDETFVELGDNVRGADVFIIQSTSTPVNEHLMELLIMVDACRRASARRITAVIPYYGYARQDRKTASKTPITAKLVANLLCASGTRRVLTMDLHAGQIQGFFDIPLDHLYAMPVILSDIKKRFGKKKFVLVSPDAGGVERVRAYAKRLGVGIAIIDKRREKANQSEAMHVIGKVKGKKAILLDDMADTAGTLCGGAKKLLEEGATEVYAYCTHAVLSGPAIDRIKKSKIKTLTVTNTIALPKAKSCKKIRVISVAKIFAQAIRRINEERSLSELFV